MPDKEFSTEEIDKIKTLMAKFEDFILLILFFFQKTLPLKGLACRFTRQNANLSSSSRRLQPQAAADKRGYANHRAHFRPLQVFPDEHQ